MTEIGVVITTCAGREENLKRVLQCLAAQTQQPASVVVVFDGCYPPAWVSPIPYTPALITKHKPGDEQPRNIGVWVLSSEPDTPDHVWFIDSDLVFYENVLKDYSALLDADPDRVLIGPYDWMPPGRTTPMPELRNDPRWVSFDEYLPSERRVNDLGSALACFGGNLVWPIEQFRDIGGFHPQLHHGRCEDGELGLRAASAGIPMSFVGYARAWHVDHPRDVAAIHEKNRRDVPLLNAWHPWVQDLGLVLTYQDGIRFDFVCPDCSAQVNSLEYWTHRSDHA